jgi:hypothetical protein
VRRYERERPGELVHVDIKKLGNIPDGGGHKTLGRATGRRNSGQRGHGYSYLHNAVDDHSRLAYSEILPDERQETAAAFWTRAQAFFTSVGITVERVLSDNGSCYRSRLWHTTLTQAGITPKRTRPYRPQTNGKVERFNRTLLDEWAYHQPYHTETERRKAFTTGSTTTITTAATPHSAATHPPPAFPTSRDRTSSAPCHHNLWSRQPRLRPPLRSKASCDGIAHRQSGEEIEQTTAQTERRTAQCVRLSSPDRRARHNLERNRPCCRT